MWSRFLRSTNAFLSSLVSCWELAWGIFISSRLIPVSSRYESVVGSTRPGSNPVLVYRGCVGELSSPNLVLQFIFLPISFRLAVGACFCGCPGNGMNFSPFASAFISGMVSWCDEKFLTNCFALVSSPFRSLGTLMGPRRSSRQESADIADCP